MTANGSGKFDPKEDGFRFPNWSDSVDFTWKQFSQTYLGIPAEDLVNGTVEKIFFETIYKNCTTSGAHCMGMSLLALAILKNGGYMGFCSPAKIYSDHQGTPVLEKLHEALDLIHPRQFGMPGIEYYIGEFPSKDAMNTFQKVKMLLEKGDYPLLSLAKGLGNSGNGHVVIPYDITEVPGKKIMYIWDSKYPYIPGDTHYQPYNPACQLVIDNSNPFSIKWSYTSKSVNYEGGDYILAIPMSVWLPKPRIPSSLSDISKIYMVYTWGGEASVSQIIDDRGRRFYKTSSDVHSSLDDLETDDENRIPQAARWIWLDGEEKPVTTDRGELYFIKYAQGSLPTLHMIVNGTRYNSLFAMGHDMATIQSESEKVGRDKISITDFSAISQEISIETGKPQSPFSITQIRKTGKDIWRKFDLQIPEILKDSPVHISFGGNFEGIHIRTGEVPVSFDLAFVHMQEGSTISRQVRKLSTKADELIQVYPKDWTDLKKTKMIKEYTGIH
jgi:hypothetical protein